MRARRAAEAAAVKLESIEDMRAFLEKLAGELAAAPLDESRKATAGAQIVRALTELDGFREVVKERDALRTEVAMLRAVGGSTREVTIEWGEAVTDRSAGNSTSQNTAPEQPGEAEPTP